MEIPAYWRKRREETGWVERLPQLVNECVEQWGVSLGPMYVDANVSFVAPADLPDGTPAVLKINVPDLETEILLRESLQVRSRLLRESAVEELLRDLAHYDPQVTEPDFIAFKALQRQADGEKRQAEHENP